MSLIACLQAGEVILRQQHLKLKASSQKKKASKMLAMQKQIDNLSVRFSSDEIDRVELLNRLSLLVAQKNKLLIKFSLSPSLSHIFTLSTGLCRTFW